MSETLKTTPKNEEIDKSPEVQQGSPEGAEVSAVQKETPETLGNSDVGDDNNSNSSNSTPGTDQNVSEVNKEDSSTVEGEHGSSTPQEVITKAGENPDKTPFSETIHESASNRIN